MRCSFLTVATNYAGLYFYTNRYKGFTVEDTVSSLKRAGYRLRAEKNGMVLLSGKAKHNYNDALVIPENHPMYNGGMFLDTKELVDVHEGLDDLRMLLEDAIAEEFYKP